MIKQVIGDLMQAEEPYIMHQVNCLGVMGSGVADQIRKQYPEAYKDYIKVCKGVEPGDLLGNVQFVQSNGKTIINVFGQLTFGPKGPVYTNHFALKGAFIKLRESIPKGSSIAIPYLMGCDRGGGDWGQVKRMLNTTFKDYEIVIYKLKTRR